MQVRVSVVTPFYNTREYLEECIRSVLAQSLGEFEYLLVDNRSTDGSLEIAKRYAALDRRIRVVTNERFLGQVENYNAALAMIGGESTYCKIVQADDWIYRTCLEEMVALADADATVGIVSSYRLRGRQVCGVGLPLTAKVTPGPALCRMQLLDDCFFFGSPSTLLFRSEIVRGRSPFYETGLLHEDTEACYQILERWNFGFVHQVLSFTRTDNESIMSSARRFDPGLLDKLIVLKKYGRIYLDADEFDDCWHRHERRYWRFLAEAMLGRKGRAFWDYHRKGLATVGSEIRSTALAWEVALVLLDWTLNPKATLTRGVRALRGATRAASRAERGT